MESLFCADCGRRAPNNEVQADGKRYCDLCLGYVVGYRDLVTGRFVCCDDECGIVIAYSLPRPVLQAVAFEDFPEVPRCETCGDPLLPVNVLA